MKRKRTNYDETSSSRLELNEFVRLLFVEVAVVVASVAKSSDCVELERLGDLDNVEVPSKNVLIKSFFSTNGDVSVLRGNVLTRLLFVELDSLFELLLINSDDWEGSSVGDERFNVILFGRNNFGGKDECCGCGESTDSLAIPDDGDNNDCGRRVLIKSKLKPCGRDGAFGWSLLCSRLRELLPSMCIKRRRSFKGGSIVIHFIIGFGFVDFIDDGKVRSYSFNWPKKLKFGDIYDRRDFIYRYASSAGRFKWRII
jgi:hypothetical protein